MSDPAKHFTEMATRIERADASEFAGAVVVVPPGEGEPIVFLLSDPTPKPAQFWSGLLSRIEVATAEARANEEAANPQFGFRR